MNRKVSFADRVLRMQTAVASLLDVLAVVQREAAAMAEAQRRFAACKPAQKRQAISAEYRLARLGLTPGLLSGVINPRPSKFGYSYGTNDPSATSVVHRSSVPR